MIWFHSSDINGNTLFKNYSDIPNHNNYKRLEYKTREGNLTLLSNDKDILKSTKKFKTIGFVLSKYFEIVHDHFIKRFVIYTHAIKKVHAQMVQKMEEVNLNVLLMASEQHLEKVDKLKTVIVNHTEDIAESLIYLQKRVTELGAHMASFEIMFAKGSVRIYARPINIRRLIINSWHAFDSKADETHISYQLNFDDHYAESNKILLDFQTMNAALFNFFDNTFKYAKPYSQIHFDMHIENAKDFRLVVSMWSLKIDENETKKIFELWYRGITCRELDGSGVGLYVVQKALELNNLLIYVDPDYSKVETRNGDNYVLNKFIISGKLA